MQLSRSGSYPFMAAAKHYRCGYGEVLRASDKQWHELFEDGTPSRVRRAVLHANHDEAVRREKANGL